MLRRILSRLPRRHKNRLRGLYQSAREAWVARFRSYGRAELLSCLREVGIREGDTVIFHSGFKAGNGFQGPSSAVVDTVLEALGASGNLLMMSLPYRGATLDYLRLGRVFDVRRTPSRMGLMSEFFRRRPGVVRSLHPTHPVMVYGPEAEWIVEGHERFPHGCGPGTPFDKAVELDGKVLFFDALFRTMTFFHWLEHRVKDLLPQPLYHPEPFEVAVVDGDGQAVSVTAYAFSVEVLSSRRFPVLEGQLRRRGIIASRRVGNTTVEAARLRDIVDCVDDMARQGLFFYDLP